MLSVASLITTPARIGREIPSSSILAGWLRTPRWLRIECWYHWHWIGTRHSGVKFL